MSKRYQELIKENNETTRYLIPSYQQLAAKLVRLARSKGVKNEDTEIVIKGMLEELTDYSNRNVDINIAIPDQEKYIEDKLTYISKKIPMKYLTKELIAAAIFCLIFVGWIVLQQWLKSDIYFDSPQNIIVEEIGENKIKISWDEVPLAEEYVIYYINTEDEKSFEKTTKEKTCVFELPSESGTYKICVYVKESDYCKESKPGEVEYIK